LLARSFCERYTIQQMLSVRTILTVVLRITTVNSVAELSLENWFCGQNLVTRMISYNSMTGPCWKYAAQVNHCCALHDNCYDLQLGRENCDQNFCDCLKRATAPDTCAATELKCLAIKKVGQQAYFDAASYEEPPSFVKIVPHIDGVENDFLLLYQECPQVMLTIKSCSLIANICMKNEEENCEQNLSECVQQAADLQNSQQCREASHQAQMSLKSKAIHRRVRRNIETKSTEATAEDKSSTTPAHTFPPIITSDHYNRHDPFTYGLGSNHLYTASSGHQTKNKTSKRKARLIGTRIKEAIHIYHPNVLNST
uniref:Phospholipase A(2) n=1 Tax=Haemonchus contortus TaxID=6289 RepID=A0A7I4YFD1_HAECO